MTPAQFDSRASFIRASFIRAILTDPGDSKLLARAIQMTRVSKFTKTERNRLSLLCTALTAYKIEGGL